jgi:predicted metal-dependent HD superfamily phosphohydrolase
MLPQSVALDQNRWLRLWSRIGAHGDGRIIFRRLAEAYGAPGRTYHNTEHLNHCLTELDQSPGIAERPDEVETALWFHDVVYLPERSDNESQSALMAESALREAGVDPANCRRVAELVLSTSHTVPAENMDGRLVCDVDLSILGAPSEQFEEFERRIRQEYHHVPDLTYRASRATVLRGFLNRPSIYQTPHFAMRYEAAARENLKRLLRTLAP